MKKFCLVLALLFMVCFAGVAEAKTVKFVASTLTPIMSEDTSIKFITLKLLQPTTIDRYELEKDALLRIRISHIQNARRAKMDAYIKGEVLAYSKPSEKNKMYDISVDEYECKIKAYSPTDFKGMAESVAVSAAGHVLNVPLLTQGVAAVKGAAHPIEGKSRLESAGINAFDSTPFSYAKKGNELNAKYGDYLTVSVKFTSLDEFDDVEEKEEQVIETKTQINLQSAGTSSVNRVNTVPKGAPIHSEFDPQPQDFLQTDLD